VQSLGPGRRFPILLISIVALVVLAIAALLFRRGPSGPATGSTASSELVIWPFRVAGADPALGYLREGMVDLLAAKLTGEAGGLRASDPRTVINAWHRATGDTLDPGPEESLRLAGELGAARALLGSVVGRASRLVLQAATYDVASGAVRARGTAEGPVDSLPELVDQLAAELLAEESGGPAPAGPALRGTPLPAVQAYLEGSQAYRSGRYQEAFERFLAAVAADSTFGPAAVGLASAAIWYPTAESERQRGFRLAWAVRERLGQADRALLTAMAGPRYPEVSSYRERLAAWEEATAIAPGRPEVWYEYGDILMHRGPLLGIAGSADLAQRAFARAVALDSSFAPPLGHLFELAAQQGDTLSMTATAALFLARDSASDLAEYIRWRRSLGSNDARLATLLRRRLPIMPVASLSRIIGASQLDGLPLDQALFAARVLESRPLRRDDQVETGAYLMELALNRGRPKEAARLADLLANNNPGEDAALAAHILNALYADGDESAGQRTAARFRVFLSTPPPARGGPRALHLWKSCAAAQWNAWHGDTTGVSATIAALRQRERAELPWWAPANEELCATMLDAVLAVVTSRPDARTMVLRLDSLTLTAPDVDVRDPATLGLARLWARLGEPARALEAVRRRQNHFRTGLPFLATRFREEVGYALAAGDTADAREASRRFQILYADPEPERVKLRDSAVRP
jgi:serine/threonine-protein kinase